MKNIVESLLYVVLFHIYPQKENMRFPQVPENFPVSIMEGEPNHYVTGIYPAYTRKICNEF